MSQQTFGYQNMIAAAAARSHSAARTASSTAASHTGAARARQACVENDRSGTTELGLVGVLERISARVLATFWGGALRWHLEVGAAAAAEVAARGVLATATATVVPVRAALTLVRLNETALILPLVLSAVLAVLAALTFTGFLA